jgi:hypothetical protein
VVALTALEIGPDRFAKLREVLGDMDEALRDEGFDALGSHAVYVRWQRACVEALGTILVEAERELGARVEKACAMIEDSSRKFRDDEGRRVELLLESGRVAINLAREANQTALVTADRAEQEFNKSVGRIAEEMSRKLLSESQKWLLLKQTERNRREAWRLAGCVAAAAVAVFIGGGATTQWWTAKESASRQAMIEALDRCWVEPRMVRTADGKTVEMCRLADLTLGRPN